MVLMETWLNPVPDYVLSLHGVNYNVARQEPKHFVLNSVVVGYVFTQATDEVKTQQRSQVSVLLK